MQKKADARRQTQRSGWGRTRSGKTNQHAEARRQKKKKKKNRTKRKLPEKGRTDRTRRQGVGKVGKSLQREYAGRKGCEKRKRNMCRRLGEYDDDSLSQSSQAGWKELDRRQAEAAGRMRQQRVHGSYI